MESNHIVTQQLIIRLFEFNHPRRGGYLRRFFGRDVNPKVNVQGRAGQRGEGFGESQLQEQLSNIAKDHPNTRPKIESFGFVTLPHPQASGRKNKNFSAPVDSVLAHSRIRTVKLSLHLGLHLPGLSRIAILQSETSIRICGRDVSGNVYLPEEHSADTRNFK
jgi:hypothetical protein